MAKQPKTYFAPHKVYVDGVLYDPNTPFTTAAPKGAEWEEMGAVDKVAAIAADDQRNDDVNLDEMNVSALQGHAASLGIDLGGVTKKADIITIIKAADDPTR